MKQVELTGILCLIWVITLLYGEMFAYWVPYFFSCSWPHLHPQTTPSRSKMDQKEYQDGYVKIAVIADPQVMDRTSLGLSPDSFALQLAQFYTDLYMRRAYLASILPFKPDGIIFLGDYFDGGPFLLDKEYFLEADSLDRFQRVFELKNQERNPSLPVYFIPGNHDVGYAILHSKFPKVIHRYEREFGVRNYRFTIGKVDFIAVDAQTLDGHLTEKDSSPWAFVKNVSLDLNSNPRVLLTHIPLYRPDWTPCGSHRKSPIINQSIHRQFPNQEIKYQNYVTKESSGNLLDLLKPVLVLSGHDHDQCTVTHKGKFGNVTEHTVGTISWQQGNLYPSFMLLSVSNFTVSSISTPEEAVLSQLCFLPMQTHIYIWYLVLFFITLLALLFWPTSGKSFFRQCFTAIGNFRQTIGTNLFGGGTKEKNEDDYCEYEEIWDAEGTMHLVKKSRSGPLVHSNDKSPVERGSAVIRPIAKKHNKESEFSMNLDIGIDSSVKPAKASKSRVIIIIQRLVRTLQMLTIIAAVNVPLYVLLLFKDWNDQLH